MKLIEKTCYSRVLYFQARLAKTESTCISHMAFTAPNFAHEGVAGYIETTVTFEITNLKEFASLWDSFYDSTPEDRTKWYWKVLNENRLHC